MDRNEIQRLATMGSALRPDWPARSLATFIEKNLGQRTYGDVAVALAWVCTRTRTETPRLLLEAGAWWKAAATETGSAPRPPRREEACATCGRREEDHKGVYDDHPFRALGRRYAADDVRAWLPEVRRSLHEARAQLCSHGVPPSHCTEAHDTEDAMTTDRHDEPEASEEIEHG